MSSGIVLVSVLSNAVNCLFVSKSFILELIDQTISGKRHQFQINFSRVSSLFISVCTVISESMPYSFPNSAAYVQNWLKVLRDDKRFIVSAAGKAEKAVSLILG